MNPPSNAVLSAVNAAMHSACQSKRGAVIFYGDYVLATGFNSKPECDGSERCKATCRLDAVHAEQAALLALSWTGPSRNFLGFEMLHVKAVDGNLAPSGPPSCVQCSKLIRFVGIEAMWLFHESGWCRYEADEFHRLSLAGAK